MKYIKLTGPSAARDYADVAETMHEQEAHDGVEATKFNISFDHESWVWIEDPTREQKFREALVAAGVSFEEYDERPDAGPLDDLAHNVLNRSRS